MFYVFFFTMPSLFVFRYVCVSYMFSVVVLCLVVSTSCLQVIRI